MYNKLIWCLEMKEFRNIMMKNTDFTYEFEKETIDLTINSN